jgi:hypothetical protein
VIARPLRLELSLPCLRLGLGPFSFDPLEQLVGAKISDLLEPLMSGPVTQRRTTAGATIDLYPLALPDGEGAAVPLGAWGELGFANEQGLLLLTLPALSAPFVVPRLGEALVGRPEPALSLDGRHRVVNLRLQLRPGARASFPLGGWGEVGLEAPR